MPEKINKGTRLAKVARELNLEIEIVVKHLRNEGFEVEAKPTTRITTEMYNLLLKDFNLKIDVNLEVPMVLGKIDLSSKTSNKKSKPDRPRHKSHYKGIDHPKKISETNSLRVPTPKLEGPKVLGPIHLPVSEQSKRKPRKQITRTTGKRNVRKPLPKINFKIEDLSLLNKRLNEKQKAAILGSLNAKDFYLIQGPPGTGKSTAISEITWQHICQNKTTKDYKILVTSETNLAVDNALTKLSSPQHNLIKPIRFGKNLKLDKEGRQFSFETFENWLKNNNDEDTKKCSLQKWKARVIKYAGQTEQSTIINELTDRWKNLLLQNQQKDNQKFYDAYLNNVNVIGATCSSIGKTNTKVITKENGDKFEIFPFTSFFWNYLKIYDTDNFNKYNDYKNLIEELENDSVDDDLIYKSQLKNIKKELRKTKIEFDLVIQDESSKATPAELALPLVYAKKAIVIGDHRQLPPMLNSNEFIDDLNALKSKTDKSQNKKIDKLIKTIKNNPKDFELSQFEKIYKYLNDEMKTSFNEQYRMHPDINEAIKQFYMEDSGLECGIPEDLLNLEDITHPASRMHQLQIDNLISPENHIIWINCDTPEVKIGVSRCNIGEVNVIKNILTKLEQSASYKTYLDQWHKLEEKQIGIISFYGAQLKLLSELNFEFSNIPIRVSTVDKFQGMERNILIVSTVRSNKLAASINQYDKFSNQKDLGFAELPNRLNVALSRAKKLLIIVGNKEHFQQKEIYVNLLKVIESLPNAKILESTEI